MADSATPSGHEGRPLSPHIQIWRFTVTMAASITHRGTGVVLYGGTLLLAYWVMTLHLHGPSFGRAVAFVHSPIGLIIVGGYVWALCFHLMNGLRHLYWDTGRGLAPKTATMTSWLVYVLSTGLAVFIMWSAFGGKGVA